MTFTEFKQSFQNDILPNKPEFIREGQALINYLGDVWVEEYKRLSLCEEYYDRNDIDCFHSDRYIPNTWEHLKEVWWAYPN